MSRRRKKDIRRSYLSDFYCTCCGNKGIPVFRTIGQGREAGHLKKLFCLHCQKEVNMAEIPPQSKYTLNDFWMEYEYGNFDEEGNRKEPWKQFTVKVRDGVIKT